MRSIIYLATLAFMIAGLATSATARDQWRELGQFTAESERTTERIRLDRSQRRITAIRVRNDRRRVRLRRLVVVYLNGDERTVRDIPRRVDARESVVIRLPRSNRAVRAIVLTANAIGRDRSSRLTISGLLPEPDRPRLPRGFESVGTVEYDGRDDDVVFRIGRRAGRFGQIRLRALDDDVRLRRIEIIFGNDKRQVVRANQRLREGALTNTIDLDGDRRFIREVRVSIRPVIRRRDTARLELIASKRPGAEPRQARFRVIGDRFADVRTDRISIPINDRAEPVSAIRIRATGNAISIRSVLVVGPGFRETFRVRQDLEDGQSSRIIEISRRPREIERVVANVDRSRRRGTIRLDVLGAGRAATPPSRSRFSDPPRLDRRGRPVGQVLFGSQRVAFRTDRDRIEVGRDRGQFDSIVFRVLDNTIELNTVTIVYGNGDRDRFDINRRVRANTVTPTFNLRGDRYINRVELRYRSVGRSDEQAVVQVYGSYSDGWLNRRFDRDRDAWVLLGAQRAQMFNRDDDRFDVGRRFGAFKAVRVTARRNDVRIYGLEITYGNGSTEEVPLFTRLKAGETSRPIDLKGRQRYIRNIAIRYRSRFSLRGEGVVEVWGLRNQRFAGRGVPNADTRDRDGDVTDDLRRKLRNLFR